MATTSHPGSHQPATAGRHPSRLATPGSTAAGRLGWGRTGPQRCRELAQYLAPVLGGASHALDWHAGTVGGLAQSPAGPTGPASGTKSAPAPRTAAAHQPFA